MTQMGLESVNEESYEDSRIVSARGIIAKINSKHINPNKVPNLINRMIKDKLKVQDQYSIKNPL
jgi:hypothetical protein